MKGLGQEGAGVGEVGSSGVPRTWIFFSRTDNACKACWWGCLRCFDRLPFLLGERNVQDNCVLHTRTGEKPTILEEEVTIGHSVTLHGCYIERKALIGIGSIVLDDVRVGAQSLVAAGSLISPGTIIPPRSLVMGMPAKVKRQLTDEEVVGLDAFWKNYVAYIPRYKSE